jgi:hypothetical protein
MPRLSLLAFIDSSKVGEVNRFMPILCQETRHLHHGVRRILSPKTVSEKCGGKIASDKGLSLILTRGSFHR